MKTVNPRDWKQPKGYSNGILCPPGGAILFIAGQIGWDEQERIAEGFLPQFRQALANVVAVVSEAGGAATDITRLIFYLTDKRQYLENMKNVGEMYREIMGRHYPAMAMVEVKSLIENAAMIEIEGTAVIYS